MAEGTSLVGLQGQPIDMMGKLSQLLTVRAQQQELGGQAARVQQEQQTARQRAAIAKYDWNRHIGDDGTIDVESVAADPELQGIAGDSYLDVITHVAQAKQQQLTAKSTLLGLRTEQRKAFAEMMTALRSDKDVAEDNDRGRQKVNEEMIRFGETYGPDTLPILSAYAPGMKNVPKGRMTDALRAIGLQAASVDQQISAQNPQYAAAGNRLTNINPNAVPGTAPDINVGLSPGTEIVTDANGRQFVRNVQTNQVTPVGAGAGGGSAPAPGAAPGAPTTPRFTQPVPQQKDLEAHISEVRKADSDYGTNRHVNEALLNLSKDTTTGPGTKKWHSVLGSIAGFTHIGKDAVSDYQKIGAFLDRQAALASSQMGLPETNAGLQTAANLSGTTDYAPDALQTKVKLTDALVEGSHQYRQGLDKVVGTGANQDLTKLQAYRAQWADNFDPNIFRVENALRRDDKNELAMIKEEVGTSGMAELKRKSENLRKLEAGELLQ